MESEHFDLSATVCIFVSVACLLKHVWKCMISLTSHKGELAASSNKELFTFSASFCVTTKSRQNSCDF